MLKTATVHAFVLSDRPAGTRSFPNGHYLIPDTNAFITGMDLFEVETAFHDVIVLQTVLEEVKNRSLPLYHRLISLTKNEDKRFYVFFNEFRMETYVVRNPGESINDRNDRAVRKAVQWYSEHLQRAVKSRKNAKAPAVVMLSDDRENLQKAKAERVTALSRGYFTFSLLQARLIMEQFRTTSRDCPMQTRCLIWSVLVGSSEITRLPRASCSTQR